MTARAVIRKTLRCLRASAVLIREVTCSHRFPIPVYKRPFIYFLTR